MKVKHLLFPAARFRTKEDALLFLECVKNNTQFPKDKHICPFTVSGKFIVENPEYRDAPFEERFI